MVGCKSVSDDFQLIFAGREIKTHSVPDYSGEDEPFLNAARLASIFLNDFM
jgi:hypothetical protein